MTPNLTPRQKKQSIFSAKNFQIPNNMSISSKVLNRGKFKERKSKTIEEFAEYEAELLSQPSDRSGSVSSNNGLESLMHPTVKQFPSAEVKCID